METETTAPVKANIKELDLRYIANTYARFPIVLTKGKGSLVWDEGGKEYIDLGSGIAVNPFGLCDEEWASVVSAQLGQLQHVSNLYYTEPSTLLAEALCEKAGMSRVFFANSGAEANECAIKTARKYSRDTYGEGRHTIVTVSGGFHGRTITTLAATAQPGFHEHFMPFTEGFEYVDAANTADLERLLSQKNVCALMFETIQGEGGVNCMPQAFLDTAAKLCAQNDVLMLIDEVQTGGGRTGTYFSYQGLGLKPDIVTSAKGLGGGLPIGAALFGEKTKDVLTPGLHGSTFGANPAVTAGALNILSRTTDEFMDDVGKKGQYIISKLESASGTLSVSGRGLMLGIETKRPVGDVLKELRERGVLALSAKSKLRLLPSLNIPWDVLSKAVDIIIEVISNETSA